MFSFVSLLNLLMELNVEYLMLQCKSNRVAYAGT